MNEPTEGKAAECPECGGTICHKRAIFIYERPDDSTRQFDYCTFCENCKKGKRDSGHIRNIYVVDDAWHKRECMVLRSTNYEQIMAGSYDRNGWSIHRVFRDEFGNILKCAFVKDGNFKEFTEEEVIGGNLE